MIVNTSRLEEEFRQNLRNCKPFDAAVIPDGLPFDVAAKIAAEVQISDVEWPLDAPQPTDKKRELLEAAIKTVADRGVPYGGVEDNFTRIARLWKSHLLNRFDRAPDLTPADVAMMMVLMKIARLENQPNHPDSWTDVAGYAACGADITSDAPTI